MTGWNGTPWPNRPDDADILRLWRVGFDTLDIARQLGCPESAVANRLPHILEADRREQGWNSTLQNTG